MSTITDSKDREIVNTRLLHASPAQIGKAFSAPERLARWWGPHGFTNTFHEFDFQPGGVWRHDMHGPDGRTYPNKSVFEEVSEQRIVIHHLESVHQFRLVITLTGENGATRLVWTQTFETVAECDKVRNHVPRCNEENLDRLEAELRRMSVEDRELVLTRIIDAPPEKVYRAWTEPELLKQWFAPLPYLTPLAELDVRSGGANFIIMRGPDGIDLPNRGVYLEVVENERLVFTDAYSKAWEPSEKPFMTVVLTFENVDGQTKYTARVRHWTVEDCQTHEKMGFHAGWGLATDQLAALAARI